MSKMTCHEKVSPQRRVSRDYKNTFMLIKSTSMVERLEKWILLYRIYMINLKYVVPVTAYYYMLHTKQVCLSESSNCFMCENIKLQ